MNTFESLLAELSRAGVEFIVVGGLAVAVAGFARVTEDVDILIQATPANVRWLIERLKGFGEGAAGELTLEDFPLEEGSVRVAETFDLDIFTVMGGRTYEALLPMTTRQDVLGTPVRFLNAEGLIQLKAGSLRPKDQLDVQALQAILREQDGGKP